PPSRPLCLLISSKTNSVACLWGIPQGAAGPERGVEMPNLMTSAAHEGAELTTTNTAAAKSVTEARGTHRFIAITSRSTGRLRLEETLARSYRNARRPCQTLSTT